MELKILKFFVEHIQLTISDFFLSTHLCRGDKLAKVTNTTVEMVVSSHAFGSIYGEDGGNLNRLREVRLKLHV